MPEYVRPVIALGPVLDDRGVPYGSRWDDGPPEDAYTRTSRLDRFAPLHEVADALVAHLRAAYDVTVEEGPDAARDVADPHPEAVRTVRVTPADPTVPALTFEHTSFPGVVVHAGGSDVRPFPPCGCDACDDIWEELATWMEEEVLVLARERLTARARPAPARS